MVINSSFANTKDEINKNILIKHQETLQNYPYNKYLGQTPIYFMEYGTDQQQYKSVQNDNSFEYIEEFVYKWMCPDSSQIIKSVDSIYNLKTNKQYYPIEINDDNILFSIQPDNELNFSYAVQDKDKSIDDILISYNYINKNINSKLVLFPLALAIDEIPDIFNNYSLLELIPIGDQSLYGFILFDQEQFQEIEINKEKYITALYILSKNNNHLHLYRWYIPCTYSNVFNNTNIDDFINIQKTGQQSIYQEFEKLSEINIDGLTWIEIFGNELDIPDVKLYGIYLEINTYLTDIPNNTIIQFTQNFLDKLESI